MTKNTIYADLEIRILKQEKAGYPVEISLRLYEEDENSEQYTQTTVVNN